MIIYTKFQIANIVVMVALGTVSSFFTKWITLQQSTGVNGEVHRFTHPLFWVWLMFVSELCCGFLFCAFYHYYKKKGDGEEDRNILTRGTRKFNPFIVLPSCIFVLIGSIVDMIAFHLTYLSSYQILGSSTIIMVAILSAIMLKRRFSITELFGMTILLIGSIIIGLCDYYLTPDEEIIPGFYVLMGDLLVILGNLFAALLLVYQQKYYFTRNDIPVLQAIGLEGFFGLIFATIVCASCQFIYVGPKFGQNPRQVMDDFEDAFIQIFNHNVIFFGVIYKIFSNIGFNYVSMTITKELSALTRLLMGYFRLVTVWTISVLWKLQPFIWEQVIGFSLVVSGVFLYSGLSIYGIAKKKTVLVN